MKLTRDQKDERKNMIENLKDCDGMIFNDGYTTVAICRFYTSKGFPGEFVAYGVSYCGPNDDYRRKYGEWLALRRWTDSGNEEGMNRLWMIEGENMLQFVTRVFFWNTPTDAINCTMGDF